MLTKCCSNEVLFQARFSFLGTKRIVPQQGSSLDGQLFTHDSYFGCVGGGEEGGGGGGRWREEGGGGGESAVTRNVGGERDNERWSGIAEGRKIEERERKEGLVWIIFAKLLEYQCSRTPCIPDVKFVYFLSHVCISCTLCPYLLYARTLFFYISVSSLSHVRDSADPKSSLL